MSDEKNGTDKPQTWAEKLGGGEAAANEKTNKGRGLSLGRIGDESSGAVNSVSDLKKERGEQQGKTFVERLTKPRAPNPQIQDLGEVKEVEAGKKNIHLKSTTALTDPEAARQNLNEASKAKDFGKETTPPSKGGFRGGSSGRGGGAPMTREPDEILKEKNDVISPEDILSKKGRDNSFFQAMNEEKKPVSVRLQQKQQQQQAQAQHKSPEQEKEEKPMTSARERTNMAKAAKEQQVPKVDKPVDLGKEAQQISVRDRMATARTNAPAKMANDREKNMEVAINKAKPSPSKSIKR